MKTFASAVVISLALVNIALALAPAEQFIVLITELRGNTITFKRGSDNSKSESAEVVAGALIARAAEGKMQKKDAKGKKTAGGVLRFNAGDIIPGGLKNEIFARIDEKGQMSFFAQLTTDEKGQVTELLVLGASK